MKYEGATMTASRRKTNVRRPIQRSLLLSSTIFMLILSVMLAAFSYFIFSQSLYNDYNSRLSSAISYIEHNIDADDLDNCIKTGVPSEKYAEAQVFLNKMIDNFGFDYIYIVIPEETTMKNAISATSAAEIEAGEADMPLGAQTDAYSSEELQRYASFWDKNEISYFEESSDYGVFYTACKPMRNSSGKTVALTCVDLSVKDLHGKLNSILIYSILSAILMIGLFGAFIIIWLRKSVTNPLLALENSTKDFASKNRDVPIEELHFDMPVIKTGNEVQSLGEAIGGMATDIQNYVQELLSAEKKIRETEKENLLLAEKAKSAAKIAELTDSVQILFSNIPAFTFSKDASTGVYLACNKAFAEYVHKSSPDEVIGLGDADLYDEETVAHFAEVDKKVLEMDKPYVFYEEVRDNAGHVWQMQTTKLKFTDTAGRLCILGMCIDITEINQIKNETNKVKEAYRHAHDESVTYSNIARALASDYAYLYYIDLKTDDFIEYKAKTQGEELAVERHGKDFFAASRRDAQVILHADDREKFIPVFTKENIISAIDKRGTFTLTYRLLVNGEPVYMHMKATRMENDDNHLIIGVNNVDAQMKYEEALDRMEEERITYSRITALSGDYICIYTVDPITDRYVEYSATKDYEGLGLSKEGDDFFTQSINEANRMICHEDRSAFAAAFTKENVLQAIRENKLFIIKYRLLIRGVPTYVCLKAALVEEKDGQQLIIGVSNINDQVMREVEYEHTLSVERSKANIDALTGLRNKHSYVDMEIKLNKRIEDNDEFDFAISVFDVNGLKQVNDTLGHNKGDELIKAAGDLICQTFLHSPVFRIGGDEFAVISQGQDYTDIDKLITTIMRQNRKNLTTGGIVVACGMARYERGKDKNVSAVFERADVKMYETKKNLKSN